MKMPNPEEVGKEVAHLFEFMRKGHQLMEDMTDLYSDPVAYYLKRQKIDWDVLGDSSDSDGIDVSRINSFKKIAKKTPKNKD